MVFRPAPQLPIQQSASRSKQQEVILHATNILPKSHRKHRQCEVRSAKQQTCEACEANLQTCDLTPKNEAINFAVTRPIFFIFFNAAKPPASCGKSASGPSKDFGRQGKGITIALGVTLSGKSRKSPDPLILQSIYSIEGVLTSLRSPHFAHHFHGRGFIPVYSTIRTTLVRTKDFVGVCSVSSASARHCKHG